LPPVLRLIDYRVYYKTLRGYVKAVDGVNLEVEKGEILGLIGESGCGKSTLIMSLIAPKPPMKIMGGKALLGETDLTALSPGERRKILLSKLSIIPQYALDALPVIRRIKQLLVDIAKEKKMSPDQVIEKFQERIRMVGLPREVINMYPLELSGGMRQRVVIAISTMLSPDLLIADEPTSALDVTTQRQVLELLRDLRDTGIVRSLIFVTHDIASVRQIADRIAVMYAGKIVEVSGTEEIIHDPLHPYAKGLINAVPKLGINYKKKRLKGLPGQPPSLLNPPPGCRFHPRCAVATRKCMVEEPPTTRIGSRIVSCWLYSGLGDEEK